MRTIWRALLVGLLACALCREAGSSTVSPVTVSLAKAAYDSRLIVVGSVEEISEHRFSTARNKMAKVRYFAVRIEEVLKPRKSASENWNRRRIAVVDPMEFFYQEQADLIAAGVISFVDARYPGKVPQIAAGDRLIFFLGSDTPAKLALPDSHFLICGHAYDTLAIKRAVLKKLN